MNIEERHFEKGLYKGRLIFLFIIFCIILVVFISRVYELQITNYGSYSSASIQNKSKEFLIQPNRGLILDRKGKILINNIPSYDLIVNASKVVNPEEQLKKLREYINLNDNDVKDLRKKFIESSEFNRELIIKRDLSEEEIAKFEVRKFMFPNAFIDIRYRRVSEYPELFSHAIGYSGRSNLSEMKKIFESEYTTNRETIYKYAAGHIIGKTGIEHTYDQVLRGKFGKRIFEIDASGKLIQQTEEILPVNGTNIITSLDVEVQRVAYEEMAGRRGAIVVTEIKTGNILAYLSSPSFSINDIANGLTEKQFYDLSNDVDKPFFDRAGKGRYSPASTIKPAIALFGIEHNLTDWDKTINDPGYFILPEDERVYRGWKDGGHGKINMKDAIIQSSNTYFFSLAYESDIYELVAFLEGLGFGKKVCSDCFFQDEGLLPTPEWKIRNLDFSWFKGDTVNIGVGQGYLSSTPLQLAYYASVIANKGESNELSLTKLQNKNINEINKVNIKERDWDQLHKSMIGVIEDPKGTAGRLQYLKKFKVAAKSGTTELVSLDSKEEYQEVRRTIDNRDHAIIIAFGPMPKPKYAVSVVIENGESGGSVAGPVAISILNRLVAND